MLEGINFVLIAHAALAAALAFVIARERERRRSPAGDRTYAMAALGAAAFTTTALEEFPDRGPQLMVGVVTGVGFLGSTTAQPEKGI